MLRWYGGVFLSMGHSIRVKSVKQKISFTELKIEAVAMDFDDMNVIDQTERQSNHDNGDSEGFYGSGWYCRWGFGKGWGF